MVGSHAPGFTALDWDRDCAGLARALGIAEREPARLAFPPGPQDEALDLVLDTTRRRGAAYEGFFRSTRPYASHPGHFVHDQMMIWLESTGLLRFDLRCDQVRVEGWVLPQHHQVFIVGAESATASLAFGIFNGVNTLPAEVVDGLLLACALDLGRTPTACAVVFERVGDLAGEEAVDRARLEEMARAPALAPAGSVPPALAAHLVRDIGPAELAQGGDWLLRLPLTRSLTRGPEVG